MFKDPEEFKKHMIKQIKKINLPKPPENVPDKADYIDSYLVVDKDGYFWCGQCTTHEGHIPDDIASLLPDCLENIHILFKKEERGIYFFCGLSGICPYTISKLASEESKHNK